jgi:hypothetical protein
MTARSFSPYTPNNLEAHERLQGKLKQAIKQTNCTMHGHECHQGLFGRNLYVGQRIPLVGVVDSRNNDRCFHHIAIIVSDMDKAYAWLRQNKVEYASSGPQQLPEWNKNAGGI